MPSATVPVRTGYILKGYYSDFNGSGTLHNDNNMNSVRDWDVTGMSLYAYWQTINDP